MRLSIIIATHNEGSLLIQTLKSVFDTAVDLNFETIVVDDGSTDGSADRVAKQFTQVKIERLKERQGPAVAKETGAKIARGETLLFLDAHTKPDQNAIKNLVEGIEALQGEAIVVPQVPALNPTNWQNSRHQVGQGYVVDLLTLESYWKPISALRQSPLHDGQFFECPALIGCAFAVSSSLYIKLKGQDTGMRGWGVEDLDLGLKSWLMGHPVLLCPQASIGHRFQARFGPYGVSIPQLLANQLRMVRKNFTENSWNVWIDNARGKYDKATEEAPEGVWTQAWTLFSLNRSTAEEERRYLIKNRVHDEYWYATYFGLSWPVVEFSEQNIVIHEKQSQPVAVSRSQQPQEVERASSAAFGKLALTSPVPPPPPSPGTQPAGVPTGTIAGPAIPSGPSGGGTMPPAASMFQVVSPFFGVSRSSYAVQAIPSVSQAALILWGSTNTRPAAYVVNTSPIQHQAASGQFRGTSLNPGSLRPGYVKPSSGLTVRLPYRGSMPTPSNTMQCSSFGACKIPHQASITSPTNGFAFQNYNGPCMYGNRLERSLLVSTQARQIQQLRRGRSTIVRKIHTQLLKVKAEPTTVLTPPKPYSCVGQVFNPDPLGAEVLWFYGPRSRLVKVTSIGGRFIYFYCGFYFLAENEIRFLDPINHSLEEHLQSSPYSIYEFDNAIDLYLNQSANSYLGDSISETAIQSRNLGTTTSKATLARLAFENAHGQFSLPLGAANVGLPSWPGGGIRMPGGTLQTGSCNTIYNPIQGKSATYQTEVIGDCSRIGWDFVGTDSVMLEGNSPRAIAVFENRDTGEFGWQLLQQSTSGQDVNMNSQSSTSANQTTCPI